MRNTPGLALKFPALNRSFTLTRYCLHFAALLVALSAPVTVLQAQSNYPTPYTFTTLAGSAVIGSADGTGNAARFYSPCGAAVDSAGNVYVADTFNHTIRKISSAGVVTTLAGTAGYSGSTDGTGSAARFDMPQGIAVDSVGNVYVADTFNHTIRKITSAGVVTTLVGTAGTAGSADGTGSAARFDMPHGVAVDSTGNVYVADFKNQTIRKITSAGVVTTLAGTAGSAGSTNGTGSTARFRDPSGIAVDISGTIYVASCSNDMIRKITSSGVVTTLTGSAVTQAPTDSTGNSVWYVYPNLKGVAVDSASNVYVADYNNHTIRMITPAGVVTTLAGMAGTSGSADGTGSSAQFSAPSGLTVDGAGNIYVADTTNSSIRKITSTTVVTTFAGSLGGAGSADGSGSTARFYSPSGAAVDRAGNVYVAESINSTIRKITASGVTTTFAGSTGSTGSADGTGIAARFYNPAATAVDSAGTVYIADYSNHTIRKITSAGIVTTLAGTAGESGTADGMGSTARFCGPSGVAVDSAGTVYVADTENHAIRKITSAGMVTTLAGTAGSGGSANGTGSSAQFRNPSGVAVGSEGSIYVADCNNHMIRKITSAGVVTTLAGSAGIQGSIDSTGNAARFFFPQGVAVDSAGNVFVADSSNSTIRKITPAGEVTTVGGLAVSSGSADGTGSAARFYFPQDITMDSAGNIYVADAQNNTIRKGIVTPAPNISSATTATGTINVAFTYQITAPNSPTAYTATGLPAGLSVNTTTGVISGTPTTEGSSTVALTASNTTTVSTANGTVTITIASASSSSSSSSSSSGASSGSGGGGGGAPSGWFLAALVLLGTVRRFAKNSTSQ